MTRYCPMRTAQLGLTVHPKNIYVEFAMWLPRYEAIAQAVRQYQRQPAVRAYLEDFAMTKRQFASQQ